MYYSGTQKAFTEFQGIINSYFDKSFQKQTFTITYKNRYPWMTNSLRQKIAEKNKLGLKALKHPDAIELNKHYKRKSNILISELRNTEIIYYSNQLEIHNNNSMISWKILKSIIGKNSTRWRPFTNTIQHLHCRHPTQSTGSGHGLRR